MDNPVVVIIIGLIKFAFMVIGCMRVINWILMNKTIDKGSMVYFTRDHLVYEGAVINKSADHKKLTVAITKLPITSRSSNLNIGDVALEVPIEDAVLLEEAPAQLKNQFPSNDYERD